MPRPRAQRAGVDSGEAQNSLYQRNAHHGSHGVSIARAVALTVVCYSTIPPAALARRPHFVHSAHSAAQPSYTAVPVTVPQSVIPTGGWVTARGLDDAGNVLVEVYDHRTTRLQALLWNQSRRTEIAPPPFSMYNVQIASASGVLVGMGWQSSERSGFALPFLMERGRIRLLTSPPGTGAMPVRANGVYITGSCIQMKSRFMQGYTGRAVVWALCGVSMSLTVSAASIRVFPRAPLFI